MQAVRLRLRHLHVVPELRVAALEPDDLVVGPSERRRRVASALHVAHRRAQRREFGAARRLLGARAAQRARSDSAARVSARASSRPEPRHLVLRELQRVHLRAVLLLGDARREPREALALRLARVVRLRLGRREPRLERLHRSLGSAFASSSRALSRWPSCAARLDASSSARASATSRLSSANDARSAAADGEPPERPLGPPPSRRRRRAPRRVPEREPARRGWRRCWRPPRHARWRRPPSPPRAATRRRGCSRAFRGAP